MMMMINIFIWKKKIKEEKQNIRWHNSPKDVCLYPYENIIFFFYFAIYFHWSLVYDDDDDDVM